MVTDQEIQRMEALHDALDSLYSEYLEATRVEGESGNSFGHVNPTVTQLARWSYERMARAKKEAT